MKKRILISFTFLLIFHFGENGGKLMAQQDPQYSQYMFNQLALNPAYAGSKEALSAAAFFRSQWTGLEGAPQTETMTLHGPTHKKKVGLGLAIIADQIGPKNSIGAMGSYAYRLRLGRGKLSMGLRFGVYNFTYNWDDITYKDQADVYNTHTRTSIIVPTADAGLYYYTNSMYTGISATHLYNGKLTTVSNLTGDDASLAPHVFFTFGKGWQLSEQLTFNPSCVVKAAKHSPATADVNMSFLLDNRFWLGVSVRSSKVLVAYAQFYATEKFKIGYAYDFGFNKIGRAGGGSHEISLIYDFHIYKSKMLSPRRAYF
jgi:type IX secretion system PorP/SprF family membrane protein